MLAEMDRLIKKAAIAADALLVALAFIVSCCLPRFFAADFPPGFKDVPSFGPCAWLLFLALPVWISSLSHFGVYRPMRERKFSGIFWNVFDSCLASILLFSATVYFLGVTSLSRQFMVNFFLNSLAFLVPEKWAVLAALRYFRRKGYNYRSVLIAGSGGRAGDFARMIEAHPHWGLRVLGFIDEKERAGMRVGNGKVIGSFNDLAGILDGHDVNEVFFILPRKMLPAMEDSIKTCEKVGVKATIATDFFSTSIAKPVARELGGKPLLTFDTVPYGQLDLLAKRFLDIALSLAALAAFAPLALVASAAIKAGSRGPVFFKQERCGLYGRVFKLYKFRTMIEGADRMLGAIRHLNEGDGPVFHARNDPRVTRVGRLLRQTSLDELPQLINVLKGDMSIVGPRPPLPDEVKSYERWQRRRLSLRPGIVCTWQVSRRFTPDFQRWMRMDLEYIDNWSLGLDMRILLRIPPALLKGFIYWKSEAQPAETQSD